MFDCKHFRPSFQTVEYLESASLMVELHGRQKPSDDPRRGSVLDAYTLNDRRRLSSFSGPMEDRRNSMAGSSGYPSTANSATVSANSVIFETDETETDTGAETTDYELETDYEPGKCFTGKGIA